MSDTLTYVTAYRQDNGLRASLNALAGEAFGIDFEPWYRQGHWDDHYAPHSLVAGGRVVANVSATTMTLLWQGVPRRAVQLGTVVTAPEYRGRGLAADLMARVLARYRTECDFLFLFAHEGVTGFYPRFGFEPVGESRFVASVVPGGQPMPLLQLNLENDEDGRLVERLVRTRQPVSQTLSALGSDGLLRFHLLNSFPQALWYAPEEDCLLVCEYQSDTLQLHDVLCSHAVDLPRLMPSILPDGVTRVEFGFTPDWPVESMRIGPLTDNGTLFLLPSVAMARPFRFPITAQA